MHKDFAKRKKRTVRRHRYRAKNTARQHVLFPGWIWMGSGLVLGLTLSAVLYSQIHPNTPEPKALPIAILEKQPQPYPPIHKKPHAKRFDFYAVLSENDANKDPYLAPLPEKNSQAAQVEKPKTLASLKPSLEPEVKPYKPFESKPFAPNQDPMMVQVGSFKHYAEADKLREQLANKGFKASIQTFKMNPQETWYRVTLGPFKSREDALQQQAKLEQSQPIHSLIVKYRV